MTMPTMPCGSRSTSSASTPICDAGCSANGLRAGVVGGTLPDELSDLLGLESDMPEASGERVITPNTAVPRVTRRVVQVNRQEQRDDPSVRRARRSTDSAQRGRPACGGKRTGRLRAVTNCGPSRRRTAGGRAADARAAPRRAAESLFGQRPGHSAHDALARARGVRRADDERGAVAGRDAGGGLPAGLAERLWAGCCTRPSAKGHSERKLILVRVLEVARQRDPGGKVTVARHRVRRRSTHGRLALQAQLRDIAHAPPCRRLRQWYNAARSLAACASRNLSAICEEYRHATGSAAPAARSRRRK